ALSPQAARPGLSAPRGPRRDGARPHDRRRGRDHRHAGHRLRRDRSVKNVINLDELKLERGAKGEKFEWNSARIGPLLGARDLGYSYDVLPPGKRGCPFHSHRAQEEMFFIVSGTGTLRYGKETRKIRAGDIICCPVGGPETAHQIVNDSD